MSYDPDHSWEATSFVTAEEVNTAENCESPSDIKDLLVSLSLQSFDEVCSSVFDLSLSY